MKKERFLIRSYRRNYNKVPLGLPKTRRIEAKSLFDVRSKILMYIIAIEMPLGLPRT